MRVYWKEPVREVRIVRPNNEGHEYEIWVLTPKLVGTVEKVAGQRVMANGLPYTNINSAARSILESAGESEMASGIKINVREPVDSVKVTGLDMVAQNAWTKFCETRKINPRSTADMNKTYSLSRREASTLGIKE